jgi:hypothetical protein
MVVAALVLAILATPVGKNAIRQFSPMYNSYASSSGSTSDPGATALKQRDELLHVIHFSSTILSLGIMKRIYARTHCGDLATSSVLSSRRAKEAACRFSYYQFCVPSHISGNGCLVRGYAPDRSAIYGHHVRAQIVE